MGRAVVDCHCIVENEYQWIAAGGENRRHSAEIVADNKILECGGHGFEVPRPPLGDPCEYFVGILGLTHTSRHHHGEGPPHENMARAGNDESSWIHGNTVVTSAPS